MYYEMYSFFCSAALLLSFHTKNKIPLNYMIVEVGIIYLFILYVTDYDVEKYELQWIFPDFSILNCEKSVILFII